MQLSRLVLFALPALAIAGVIPGPAGSSSDKCYSGSLLCCGKMADPSRPDGVDPDDPNSSDNSQGKMGSQCFPIEIVVGGLENPCAAAEVCCVSYNPDKLVAYGCVEDLNSP